MKQLFLIFLFPLITVFPQSEKLISFGPNITQIFIALEAEDQLIGITDYCHLSPFMEQRLKEGQLLRLGGVLNPNYEKILALQPNLILYYGKMKRLIDFCKNRHIPTKNLGVESINLVQSTISSIGEMSGKQIKAINLIEKQQQIFQQLEQQKPQSPPKVLLISSRSNNSLNSIWAVGHDTFLSELLIKAGGQNVLPKETATYFAIPLEKILAYNPDFIIEFEVPLPGDPESGIKSMTKEIRQSWEKLNNLKAYKNKHIIQIHRTYALQAGPYIHLLAQDIKTAITP